MNRSVARTCGDEGEKEEGKRHGEGEEGEYEEGERRENGEQGSKKTNREA